MGYNIADNGNEFPVQIVHALYTTCTKLGAKSDLLCILGSFRDTLDDKEVLDELRAWNDDQPGFKHVVECVKSGSSECVSCRDNSVCAVYGREES